MTAPFSARTMTPFAAATTQASLVTHPAGSPGGAKSIAAQADPESQPPCGPPVNDQVCPGSKGNCIGGWYMPAGSRDATCISYGLPKSRLYVRENPNSLTSRSHTARLLYNARKYCKPDVPALSVGLNGT